MLKKTITYTDYNGLERTEDFYFNFSVAELMEMELSMDGGMIEYFNKIVAAKDAPTLIRTFKDFVLKAYGEKSSDGKRFMKSKEISEAFAQTEAYSNIFMELAFDSEKAAEFFNGVIPQNIDAKTAQAAGLSIASPTN